jgi:hypothetical protein
MTTFYIEGLHELTAPELAAWAAQLREHHRGRTDPKLLASLSDEQLVSANLQGRAASRRQIAEAEARSELDPKPLPETEEQLRARVIAERVLKEETEKKQRA